MSRFVDSLEGVSTSDLQGFFVGWPSPPSPDTHLELLRGSQHFLLAQDDNSSRVLGFITAISDGVLCAYIPLLEVLPEYQHMGLGSELSHRMLEHLKHLYMVDLLCDDALQPFYEKQGMRCGSGMMLRNYERQSGADKPVPLK